MFLVGYCTGILSVYGYVVYKGPWGGAKVSGVVRLLEEME